jgi:hypothetical protein
MTCNAIVRKFIEQNQGGKYVSLSTTWMRQHGSRATVDWTGSRVSRTVGLFSSWHGDPSWHSDLENLTHSKDSREEKYMKL